MPLPRPTLRIAIAAAFLGLAAPAAAQQFSEGYKFLQAVRDEKGDVVVQMLSTPGSTIVNTKDRTTGEGALHISVRKGSTKYVEYLLQQKADPNIRDGGNNTPLILAISLGKTDIVPLLLAYNANVNLGNSVGETPLILAVQRRDLATVRILVDKGANPDKTDNVGMSARAYAARDGRSPEIAKLLADLPKRDDRKVAGPRL